MDAHFFFWYIEMAKIYIAGSSDNRTLICVLAKILGEFTPHTIVSQWHSTPPLENIEDRALMDQQDMEAADVLLATFPYGTGTSSEIGYCVGRGKKVERTCGYHDEIGRAHV